MKEDLINIDILQSLSITPTKLILDDFKYFLYLSRKNAWVSMNDDLYTLNFGHVKKTMYRPTLTEIRYDEDIQVLSAKEENVLKLNIARELKDFRFSSITHDKAQVNDLNPITFKAELFVEIENKLVWLDIIIENFDAHFIKQRKDFQDRQKEYDEAVKNTKKNSIWCAAASGDDLQMKMLLKQFSPSFLHECYKNKDILSAMLTANDRQDLPFKAEKADYTATLSYLIHLGHFNFHEKIANHDDKTFVNLYEQYKAQHNNLRFFEFYNPVVREILSLLEEKYFPKDHENYRSCYVL